MRGSPCVQMIAPRIRARLDCDESIKTGLVGQGPAGASEIGVERCVMVVDGIQVASCRVGLPDFDERVADRFSVAVQHAPRDDDPLAKGLALMLSCEVCILSPYTGASERPSRR